MHPVLTISLIVGNIFDFAARDIGEYESDDTISAVLVKHRLTAVCRLWRAILAQRTFADLYFYIERSPYYKIVEDDVEYDKSNMRSMVEIADGRFLLQTNMDFVSANIRPRSITIELEDGSMISSNAIDYLTTEIFGKNVWPSVRELYISIGNPNTLDFADRVDYRPLESMVQAVLSQSPDIVTFGMHSEDWSDLLLNAQKALGMSASNITKLDMYTDGCDFTELELPALTDMTVRCYGEFVSSMIPVYDASKIQRLRLLHIPPRDFIREFERTASQGVVSFSQLEELDIEFICSTDDLTPINRGSSAVRFVFPKLRYLGIKTQALSKLDLFWMFKDAPLEYLSLKEDINFCRQLDMAKFPSLVSVSIKCSPFTSPLERSIVECNFIRPHSNLRHLSIGYMSKEKLKASVFGCLSLRSLYIGAVVSSDLLEGIIVQLPQLVDLGIGYWKSDFCKKTNLKNARLKVKASSGHALLSTSLQGLTVLTEHSSDYSDRYHRGIGSFIPVLARIPSLLKMSVYGSNPGDQDIVFITEALTDKRIRKHATHLADLSLSVEPCYAKRMFYSANE